MNREQFYQGLVAESIAGRIAREVSPTIREADERWLDEFFSPVEEAKRNTLIAILKGFTKIPSDDQERWIPVALDYLRMTVGEIYEEGFRRMLRGWTAPKSAEAVVTDLDITVTFGRYS